MAHNYEHNFYTHLVFGKLKMVPKNVKIRLPRKKPLIYGNKGWTWNLLYAVTHSILLEDESQLQI
jgi:hypothetical protein